MARKLLICVSAFHATAALWNGKRLLACRAFEDDEDDHIAFQRFLASAHGAPVHFMVDTVDEDYRFETLPHATGRDRAEMVDRKLKQLYRGTPYCGVSLQEREGDKRRDDRFLFVALTNPEILDPWLHMVNASALPIAGVFSLPMVSLAALKPLELNDSDLLLVSKHAAGIRLTFFKAQRFRLSRLIAARTRDVQGHDACAEEVRNTRMYLDALNVTHVDDSVEVAILDRDGSLEGLGEAIGARHPGLICKHFGPQALASKLALAPATLQSSEDALHLHLLGLYVPRLSLAPAGLTRGYERHQIRKVLYAASAAAGLSAAVWCGINLYEAMGLHDQAKRLINQTQGYQRAYQETTRTFPPTPKSSAELKHTVEVAQSIDALSRTPQNAFSVVSQALEKNSGVSLAAFQWQHGPPGIVKTGEGASSAPLSQAATVQVELKATPGDYKSTLAAINGFVRDLSSNELVAAAHTVKMPVNLDSTATLSGSTSGEREANSRSAQFEVLIVLKPGV